MIYGYIRVSTEHQDASAEAQQAKLAPLCDRLFTDSDVSGATRLSMRPAGKEMWDSLQPGDTVVITSRDRAFRNLLDAIQTLERWQGLGVRLRILDFPIDLSTDEGQMMFQILTVFASYERAMTKRRTRTVLAHKRERCLPYGHLRPYGWKRRGNGWVEFPEERKIADLIASLRASGSTWGGIARALCLKEIRKPYCRKNAHGYYSQRDARALISARAAGYPMRSQVSWRSPDCEETQHAG